MATNVNAQTVAWEVRPTNGDDTFGGGFVAGASGTDRSQQNSAQVVIDNSTITCTTPGANSNTLTFTAGYTPSAADIGNVVQISAGTNINTGFYRITAQTSTTWTLAGSTNLTTAGGAGSAITGKMGGALKTIPTAISGSFTSNKLFVKAESTISTTATITLSTAASTPSTTQPMNRIIGYTTSRGDGGRVTIQLSTNTGLIGLSSTTDGWSIENVVVDCASLGTSTGIKVAGRYSRVHNCIVKNFTTAGISYTGSNGCIYSCEITSGSSAATAGIQLTGASTTTMFCDVHDNACPGITTNNTNNFHSNLITNNTGASSDGLILTSSAYGSTILRNTIHGSGRHGINFSISFAPIIPTPVKANLLTSNGGYGIANTSAAGIPADPLWDGNGFWNNTSGTRNNLDDTTTNPINGVAAYTNTLDVTCTANPYTNSAGGDFTLNNTAGGGAALRGTGSPGAIAGVSQVGYADLGLFQHQDSGGAAGMLYIPNLEGI